MEFQTDTTKFISLKMKATPLLETFLIRKRDIIVTLNFHHYREIHHCCEDETSPFPKDHTILSKELDEDSSFETFLVFPPEPETVEFYVACAEMGEDWPDYVCRDVWEGVKEKVAEYVLVHADFDAKLGFEMMATIEVSTLDNPCC